MSVNNDSENQSQGGSDLSFMLKEADRRGSIAQVPGSEEIRSLTELTQQELVAQARERKRFQQPTDTPGRDFLGREPKEVEQQKTE